MLETGKKLLRGTLVTPAMAQAMTRWQRAFYALDVPRGAHSASLARTVTGYLSELATAEMSLTVPQNS